MSTFGPSIELGLQVGRCPSSLGDEVPPCLGRQVALSLLLDELARLEGIQVPRHLPLGNTQAPRGLGSSAPARLANLGQDPDFVPLEGRRIPPAAGRRGRGALDARLWFGIDQLLRSSFGSPAPSTTTSKVALSLSCRIALTSVSWFLEGTMNLTLGYFGTFFL